MRAPAVAADAAASRAEVATGTLRLCVVDEDGRGVAGVPIAVFCGSQLQGSRSSAALLRVASRTGAVDQPLPCGAFTVIAMSGDGGRWSEAVAEVVIEAGKVATAELRVREAAASLVVRVVDDTGEPVANVPVRVLPAGARELPDRQSAEMEVFSFSFSFRMDDVEPRPIKLPTLTDSRAAGAMATSAKTDSLGAARFKRLFAGDYVVSLIGKRTLGAAVRHGTSQRVTIARRQEASLDFRLPRSGIVSVRVTGPDTWARGCIRFTAQDEVFDDARVEFPFGRGVLRASWLPPGTYAVSCELWPGTPVVARAPRHVVICSGQTTHVVVDLFEAKAARKGGVVDEVGR